MTENAVVDSRRLHGGDVACYDCQSRNEFSCDFIHMLPSHHRPTCRTVVWCNLCVTLFLLYLFKPGPPSHPLRIPPFLYDRYHSVKDAPASRVKSKTSSTKRSPPDPSVKVAEGAAGEDGEAGEEAEEGGVVVEGRIRRHRRYFVRQVMLQWGVGQASISRRNL